MLTPDKLICEYLVNPLGLDVRQPRLSWLVRAQQRDARQTAYQIRVASSPAALEGPASGLLWDSGRVASDASLHIVYAGPELQPGQRCFWQVRVWDAAGEVSPWSARAFWEMGLLGSEWQAEWITPDWYEDTTQSQPSPMLRRDFTATGALVAARIYATSLGIYELHLNGQRVGDAVLTPGWTSYDQRLQYQTYDVTELVREGENALGAMLGDGWYRGYMAHRGHRNVYGETLALLLQLHLTYADGRVEIVSSDTAWQAATGPIRMADLYRGETYDAQLEQAGWDAPDFDASGWCAVRTYNHTKATVVAQVGPYVRAQSEIQPVRLLRSPAGETILDFGQNLVGWVKLRVRGPRGTTVTLRHAEVLDQQGNLYTENLRTADQAIRYTLKGSDTEEVFEPHFTFQGFQYVAVEGYPGELRLEQFRAVVLHSDMAQTGTFECSNPLINQLQHNILWGQKGNFVDVPSDCPQRDERLGWSGDTQVFVGTACFNMDVAAFFTKWLRDLSADQLPNGSVAYVSPDVLTKMRFMDDPNSTPAAGAAAWGDAAIICPWTIYLSYGDTRLLEEQYASMVGWVHFMRDRAGESCIWQNDSQFGDWLDYRGTDARRPSPVTNIELVATAFYAYSTGLLAQAAQVLGKTADAAYYRELAEKVKTAFRNEFVTPSGRVGSNTQTAYVLALHFDLLPEAARPLAAARLAETIRQAGYHLTTGFVGTPYICHVLSRFGYTDIAYELLNQESYPSWLYPVKQGATTIWERWDGIKPDGSFQDAAMNSFNHYAYGAIGEWLYRVVAGITADPEAPGYKRVHIQPQPGGELTHASASLETLYGRAESAWALVAGALELRVTIPANTEGVVHFVATPEQIREQGQALAQAAGVRSVQQEGETVLVTLGSGEYHFRVA